MAISSQARYKLNLPEQLSRAVTDAGARIRFRYPWWLRLFVMRDIVGITIGRRIYLSANVAEKHVERFLRHELTHVRQINRSGLLRFYWQYVREYIGNRRRGMGPSEAYRSISFEQEARSAEEGDRRQPIIDSKRSNDSIPFP